jgi:hypothetical protein
VTRSRHAARRVALRAQVPAQATYPQLTLVSARPAERPSGVRPGGQSDGCPPWCDTHGTGGGSGDGTACASRPSAFPTLPADAPILTVKTTRLADTDGRGVHRAQVAVNGVRMVPATARRMAAELLAAAALADEVNGDG